MVLTLLKSADAPSCTRPGCTGQQHARGLCHTDYKTGWRRGEFGMFSAEPPLPPSTGCAAPACREPVHADGLCRRHEWQVKRHGRITDVVRWWMPPQPWTARAACAVADPDLWFADPSDTGAIAEAKRICAACPVSGACLAHATATGERDGIWGGLTPDERQATA